MKLKLFLGIILILLFSCNKSQKNENPTSENEVEKFKNLAVNELMKSMNSALQVFDLPSNKPSTVNGKKGLKVYIDPNDLETLKGEKIKANIKLELIEATEKNELILNGIPTISDDKILETGGAYYIQAYSENEKLRLKSGRTLKIDLPKYTAKDMELFSGSRSESSFNWTPLNQNLIPKNPEKPTVPENPKNKTDAVIEDISGDSEMDEIIDFLSEDSKKSKSKREKMSKEEYEKYLKKREEYQKKLKIYEEELKTYQLVKIDNFGWINCDRFINEPNSDNKLLVTYTNDQLNQVVGYLVFKDIKSVLQEEKIEIKKEIHFKNLPKGRKVKLMVVGATNNETYFSEKEITIGEQNNIELSLALISREELKSNIERIK